MGIKESKPLCKTSLLQAAGIVAQNFGLQVEDESRVFSITKYRTDPVRIASLAAQPAPSEVSDFRCRSKERLGTLGAQSNFTNPAGD
jgi:hypothetical protein